MTVHTDVTYESWVYPNHGGKDNTQQYESWIPRFTGSMLVRNGFTVIEDMSLASASFADSDVYKRVDDMGRVIYISANSGRGGGFTATHNYLNYDISSTFRVTQDYALDLINGRNNEWLFLSYPQEED